MPMRDLYLEGQGAGGQALWRAFLLPWLLLTGSWGVLGVAFLTGHNSWLDHDYLIRGNHWPWPLAGLVFLASWQVMLLAMMLPGLFNSLLLLPHHLARYWPEQVLFIVGYAGSWSLFACAAFVGDTLLHGLVGRWRWLYLHPQWIAALLFALAGLVQWSPLKWHCLRHTRLHQQETRGSPWRQGYRYGLWCVGCNWALMLLMVGVGMRNLLALASLTLLMWLERTWSRGKVLGLCAGAGCLLYALVIVMPPIF
ncbi:hypothetical protein KDH_70760 [Dictyobacter sp. S3.2.2.5]|uniref:DUF2182 domain-containing protein n=1 Tax=Dictyobacter halimunensis TaxID=3026934 RepID=A0ABQ6G6L4_9CHLR|nr:hypothetical protein KDH_70760 [Dictyobacter sp. S3.2.2.5]